MVAEFPIKQKLNSVNLQVNHDTIFAPEAKLSFDCFRRLEFLWSACKGLRKLRDRI